MRGSGGLAGLSQLVADARGCRTFGLAFSLRVALPTVVDRTGTVHLSPIPDRRTRPSAVARAAPQARRKSIVECAENPRSAGIEPRGSALMSEQILQPEPPYRQGEFDESQFDEETLHARRRQYGLFAASIAILAVAILAIPFSDHVKASGRVAPQRWAQVRSEVPGVLHEATHTNGDVVEEGAVIAVLDFDEQRDAVAAARLRLPRERQKLADLELRQRENTIQREGADAVAKSAGQRAAGAQHIDGSRL